MTLIEKIAKVAGRNVELTVRGERAFTLSYDGRDDAAAARLVGFFESVAACRADYDEDCDHTCVYVDA